MKEIIINKLEKLERAAEHPCAVTVQNQAKRGIENSGKDVTNILTIFLYIVILLFLSSKFFAQSGDDAQMTYFYGGNLRLNASLGFTSFNSGGFGGVISSTKGGSEAVFSNPAFLAASKKADLKISLQPSYNSTLFGIDKNSILDDKTIGDATDDILSDNSAFTFAAGTPQYNTQVGDFALYQGNGLGSISMAYPLTDKVTLGLGYNSPVNVNLDMNLNNISTNIRTVKTVGSNDTQIDMLLYPSVNAQMDMRISQLSISAGAEILNDKKHYLTAGISFTRFFASNKIDISFISDGMIVLNSGNEYFFNDPYDANLIPEEGETNDLYWKASGNYTGAQSGFKIGAFYHSDEYVKFLSFSSSIEIMPVFILEDENANTVSYQPRFFTGKFTGTGDEELDIVIDSIDLAKPNLTKETFNNFTKMVRINFPSSWNLGIEYKLGKQVLVLNYTKYFGEYSYKFERYKAGFIPASGINFGADLRFPDKMEGWDHALIAARILFLDFDGLLLQYFADETGYTNPHYRIGGGVMLGNTPIAEGFDKDQQKTIRDILGQPLPNGFALSREYTILNNLRVGVVVFGFPDLLTRFTFGWGF